MAEGQSAEEAEAAHCAACCTTTTRPPTWPPTTVARLTTRRRRRRSSAAQGGQGARNAAEANHLADKNRMATLIQQFFPGARWRRATADPRGRCLMLDRFTLLEKQTKQLTDESEAALEVGSVLFLRHRARTRPPTPSATSGE